MNSWSLSTIREDWSRSRCSSVVFTKNKVCQKSQLIEILPTQVNMPERAPEEEVIICRRLSYGEYDTSQILEDVRGLCPRINSSQDKILWRNIQKSLCSIWCVQEVLHWKVKAGWDEDKACEGEAHVHPRPRQIGEVSWETTTTRLNYFSSSRTEFAKHGQQAQSLWRKKDASSAMPTRSHWKLYPHEYTKKQIHEYLCMPAMLQ